MSISKFDHYHTHYDNRTYRAFHQALTESAAWGQLSETQTNTEFIHSAMNLLIDASFERCAIDGHEGAEHRLMEHIDALDSRVATCARIHLANFGDPPLDPTIQALDTARQTAESAATTLSDVPAWRARTAFAWTNAAVHLLHAASAVMVDTHTHDYSLEKVDHALSYLSTGMYEAQADMSISPAFMAWLRQIVGTGGRS